MVKKEREVKAVFEVMAYLAGAIEGTRRWWRMWMTTLQWGTCRHKLKWALIEMASRLGVRTELTLVTESQSKKGCRPEWQDTATDVIAVRIGEDARNADE